MPSEPSIPGQASPRPWTLGALFYCGIASAGLAVLKPLIVGGLIDDYGFTPQQAGFVAGVEMVGIGAAAFIVAALGSAWNRRRIVLMGAILGIVGSLVAALPVSFEMVFTARLVAGVGSGLIASIVLASIGCTSNPDRTLGIYLMVTYLTAAALFPLSSLALRHFGGSSLYLLLAVLLVGVLWTGRVVTEAVPVRKNTQAATAAFPIRAACSSLGVSVAFWIGMGAIWAFAERLGRTVGADDATIGTVLAAAQLSSIAGAAAASIMHTRANRVALVSVTISVAAVSVAFLGFGQTTGTFVAGALLFTFAWPLFVTQLGGIMASQESTGRILAMSVTSQTVGMAIGPVLGGMLASSYGYQAVALLALACQGVALAALQLLRGSQERRRNDFRGNTIAGESSGVE